MHLDLGVLGLGVCGASASGEGGVSAVAFDPSYLLGAAAAKAAEQGVLWSYRPICKICETDVVRYGRFVHVDQDGLSDR